MAERELSAQEIGELLRPMLGPVRAFQHLKTLVDEAIKLESRQQSVQAKIAVLGETLPQLEAERLSLIAAIEGYTTDKHQAEEVFTQTMAAQAEALTQADERLRVARGEILVASEEVHVYLQSEMAKIEGEAAERRRLLEVDLLARETEWHVEQHERETRHAEHLQRQTEMMAEETRIFAVRQQEQAEQWHLQEEMARERLVGLGTEAQAWQAKIDGLKADVQALV